MSRANIQDLGANGWLERTYEIATKDGFETVAGVAKGPIAVREQCAIELNLDGSREFHFWQTVEHMASGRKIAHYLSKGRAFQFADKIAALAGWNQITWENPAMPGDLLEAVKKFRDDPDDDIVEAL